MHYIFRLLIYMQQIPTSVPTNSQKIFIEEVSYRWVIFFVYAINTFLIGMITVVVAPISNTLVNIYNVPSIEINAIFIIFMLEYGIINLPANFFIDDHGIRTGLLIGISLTTLGAGIQMLVNQSFISVIIGSLFIGIGQPFIVNCTTKIPTFWFFKQNVKQIEIKRVNVINILTLFNLIGAGAGFVVPTLIVDQYAEINIGKSQVFQLFMIYFIIAATCLLLVIFLIKNKPEKPPSYGSKCEKILFKQSLEQIKKNKNFIILCFGYSAFIGPLSALASLMNFLLRPFNFSDMDISIFGILVLLSGIIGSTFASFYVSKTLRYDLMSRVFTTFSVISIIIFLILLKFAVSFSGMCALLFFLGFFITPLFPLSYDFGCELIFPVGQAQATGIIYSGGCMSSLILIIILQFCIGFGTREQSFNNLIILAVMMFVGCIIYFFIDNDLKRRNLQQKKQVPQENVLTSEMAIEKKQGQQIQL